AAVLGVIPNRVFNRLRSFTEEFRIFQAPLLIKLFSRLAGALRWFATRDQDRKCVFGLLPLGLVLGASIIIGDTVLRLDLIGSEPFLCQQTIDHKVAER